MQRVRILDGGLATSLEAAGQTLHPRLWSAGTLIERPDAVEAVHRAFVRAGAEILISASYQLTFDGLGREGLSRREAEHWMRESVVIARRASERSAPAGRPVLVAASVGPYGAGQADGSEYRGDYGLSARDLAEFHRERFEILCDSGADLLAMETIPCIEEAEALLQLLRDQDRMSAWLSFSCRDGARLRDGEPLVRAVSRIGDCPRVRGVGINCTDPEHVADLMEVLRSATDRPIVVYPNSGERWDAASRSWSGEFNRERFCMLARDWARRGAWAVGGCCRIGPDVIRSLALDLNARPSP